MKYVPLLIFIVSMVLTGCRRKNSGKEHFVPYDSDESTKKQDLTEKDRNNFSFICDSTEWNENGIPSVAMYGKLGNKEYFIDSVYNCGTFQTPDNNAFNIPENALDAFKSFYAGQGMYYYALPENETVTIYKTERDEMRMDSFEYKQFAVFKNEQFVRTNPKND